ncbi:DUF2189 domain-containing protein [Aquabacter sp. CN5-332]|uniref:DUF2189 domain-containing protein n=1 Tax=Aquabacter sp. CN5-332 TaxID=3156608 RepID=UPI0032B55F8B
MTIRNPVEWSADQVKLAIHAVRSANHELLHVEQGANVARPLVRRITVADLKDVVAKGFADFAAYRTDVLFICLIYPLAGLLLARFALGQGMLPLLFPLVSGFALIGPFAAAGLYEMSRRREQGAAVTWFDAFGVFQSPALGRILELGLLLTAIFVVWLVVAMAIYVATFGLTMPTSYATFAQEVFTTRAGWTLILVGVGAGFLFALLVLAISAISFPLLIDRPVGVSTAIRTSIRAFVVNPVPMLAWGLIVAGSLVLGAIPALVGLIVVMPVLGHATWHLYRRLVF